jgi:hypothetical protein
MDPIPSVTADQLTRALGEAVVRIWSNLPQDVQNHLFQAAVTSQGESIRPRFRRPKRRRQGILAQYQEILSAKIEKIVG